MGKPIAVKKPQRQKNFGWTLGRAVFSREEGHGQVLNSTWAGSLGKLLPDFSVCKPIFPN
jgi:hypothetical protein